MSSSAGMHFVGLAVGASRLRSRFGPRLSKKLKQVDVAHTALRHIMEVYTQQLMHEVGEALGTLPETYFIVDGGGCKTDSDVVFLAGPMPTYVIGEYAEQLTQNSDDCEEKFTQAPEGTKHVREEGEELTNEREDTGERKGKCAAKLLGEYVKSFTQKSEEYENTIMQSREGTKNVCEEVEGLASEREDTDKREGNRAAKLAWSSPCRRVRSTAKTSHRRAWSRRTSARRARSS